MVLKMEADAIERSVDTITPLPTGLGFSPPSFGTFGG